jgi:hypothetical protein
MIQESERCKLEVALRVLRHWTESHVPEPVDLELLRRLAEFGEDALKPDDLARAVVARCLTVMRRSATA